MINNFKIKLQKYFKTCLIEPKYTKSEQKNHSTHQTQCNVIEALVSVPIAYVISPGVEKWPPEEKYKQYNFRFFISV